MEPMSVRAMGSWLAGTAASRQPVTSRLATPRPITPERYRSSRADRRRRIQMRSDLDNDSHSETHQIRDLAAQHNEEQSGRPLRFRRAPPRLDDSNRRTRHESEA